MKNVIIDILVEARNKIENQKLSNLSLSQRISNAMVIEKLNLCIKLLRNFTNIQ